MLVNSMFKQNEIEEMPTKRYGTRMTRIGRIFTDIFNRCVSVSSVQSVFYRISTKNECHKKPQINADERRYITVSDFIKITHRKERKERKAMLQEPLCPLCTLWLNIYFPPLCMWAIGSIYSASAFICVYLRLNSSGVGFGQLRSERSNV